MNLRNFLQLSSTAVFLALFLRKSDCNIADSNVFSEDRLSPDFAVHLRKEYFGELIPLSHLNLSVLTDISSSEEQVFNTKSGRNRLDVGKGNDPSWNSVDHLPQTPNVGIEKLQSQKVSAAAHEVPQILSIRIKDELNQRIDYEVVYRLKPVIDNSAVDYRLQHASLSAEGFGQDPARPLLIRTRRSVSTETEMVELNDAELTQMKEPPSSRKHFIESYANNRKSQGTTSENNRIKSAKHHSSSSKARLLLHGSYKQSRLVIGTRNHVSKNWGKSRNHKSLPKHQRQKIDRKPISRVIVSQLSTTHFKTGYGTSSKSDYSSKPKTKSKYSIPALPKQKGFDVALRHFLGSANPSHFLSGLFQRVIPEDMKLGHHKFSPRLLSPILIDDRLANETEMETANVAWLNRALSPSVLSIFNRSDSLLKLPEIFRNDPATYTLAAALLLHLSNTGLGSSIAGNPQHVNRIRNKYGSILGSDGETPYDIIKDVPHASIRNKSQIHWLFFQPTNLTENDRTLVDGFHRKWESNAKLRAEWRNFYKQNRSLSDAKLNRLMTLNATRPFEEVLRDAVIDAPYLLNPESASSPGVLAPLIRSPYILSPYIFGPFILSPLVLTPQIISPSIFAPSVLSPYLLAPLILSPGAFDPGVLSPFVLSPGILSPAVFNPSVLDPVVLNPCILSPTVLSPGVLNPGVLSPAIMCPTVLPDSNMAPPVLSPSILS